MQSAPLPDNEFARLAALQRLDVLDTEAEAEFDALVKVASLVCGVPISLISLIDSDRQWFKANVGLPEARETPRTMAFCAHAILDDQLFVVPDATQDPRFFDNPLVASAPDIRFYAGAPIVLGDGHRVGTLCVIDRQPRQLTDQQRETLAALAVAAARALEGRRAMQLQQLVEAELREARLILNRTNALAKVGGWQVDLATGQALWTDETCRMHGVEPGFTPQLNEAIEFYEPHVLPLLEAAVRTCIETGQGWDLELPLVPRRGDPIWVRGMGSVEYANNLPVRLVGVVQDVTERRAERLALLAARERVAIATKSAGIGIWDLDLATGTVMWDAQTYRLWGLVAPDEHGRHKSWAQGIHPEDLPRVTQAIAHSVATGSNYSCVFRVIWPDHSVHHLSAYGQLSLDDTGTATQMIGTNIDVTESVNYAESLKEARLRAEDASQSKGQFLANMSHEIRTPMNAILGLLSLLQNTELTPRQRDYASKTEGAAQSLLGLLNDILDFSKVEAGKMTLERVPFRLDRLLRNLSVVLSANVGGKPLEVLFDVDTTLPPVLLGDALRLQQVLINLGGNAVKFTSQGQVVIGLRQRGLTDTHVSIEFSVQDSGIGMAPASLTHIFDGFSQAETSTTRRFGGTGLGLAICKRLVALMGGAIGVTSEVGRGSTFAFTVTLPWVAEAPPELAMPARPSLDARRALLIDDNAVAGELMERYVRAWGWPADLVASGAQALALVQERQAPGAPFPFDVVFVDLQMPDMDGWETARRLRQCMTGGRGPQPLIIMVTGHGREALARRTPQEQDMLNGFLVKPITGSMMLDAVMDASSGLRSLRETARGRSSQRRLSGMRILVVEDNLINQQVAEELLTTEGALVSMAANGQLGVEAVAAAAPQFDVVLMDLQMPVLDGYGATRAIRTQLGLVQLPIVAMTANAMASDREACLAAGMNEHVGKPFDLNHLVSVLVRLTGMQPAPADAQRVPATEAVVCTSPDLDWETALVRMSGMKSLYARTARDFCRYLEVVMGELQSWLAQGDMAQAAMLLHTLKGNAGTLGAQALALEAARLEQQCKAATGTPAPPLDLAHLAVQCDVSRRALWQAAAALDPVLAPAPAPDATANTASASALASASMSAPASMSGSAAGQVAQARAALQTLQALLVASDLSVLARHDELQAALSGLPQPFLSAFEAALQQLDLPAARTLCQGMLQQLPA